jgi:DNA-binding response OmpR family regulator
MQNLSENGALFINFLSAFGIDDTTAKALELGAIDYIVKPFLLSELIARVRAAPREDAGPPEPFKVGEPTID